MKATIGVLIDKHADIFAGKIEFEVVGQGILSTENSQASLGQPVLEFKGQTFGPGDVPREWQFTDRGLENKIAETFEAAGHYAGIEEDRAKLELIDLWRKLVHDFQYKGREENL